MRNVKKLLDFLTEKFPPGENQRHVIGVENNKLTVWLMLGELYLPLIFGDGDFNRPIDSLCNELAEVAQKALRGE